MTSLLEVKQLTVTLQTENGSIRPVDQVDFSLKEGETLAIVGESGSGKSITALSLLRLLPRNGSVSDGEVWFEGQNLLKLSAGQVRGIRGNQISMIFQEPMTSLNPVLTIGDQLTEVIKLHLKLRRREAWRYAVQMLDKVGIPRPDSVMKEYPHLLSGGMKQRIMIAMALACRPRLLVADEPTTALDVTIQAQILRIINDLRKETGTAVIFITHDLGVVAEMADKVVVMYAGQIVEAADVYTLFDSPAHPYTQGLMKSIPDVENWDENRLESISGTVPSLYEKMQGCRFQARCPHAAPICRSSQPPLTELADSQSHAVRCWLAHEKTG